MSIPRIACDDPLAEGVEIEATPGQAHYLGAVLRRAAGDAVRLFNARDGEFEASIAAIRKDRARFAVGPCLRAPSPVPEIRLLIAAVKRDAMEWTVEKATELGVAAIQPVFTRRSVADRVNTDRLALIAREAAEQCERLDVPRLHPAAPLHAVLDAWDGAPLLVAAERMDCPPLIARAAGLRPPLGWLVGPEGGFERAELDDLGRRLFVAKVALGPRILRAETAAVAGLALLQAAAGDWT
jgi:16S rRNA (uracil1498-N3)-methyltransferase